MVILKENTQVTANCAGYIKKKKKYLENYCPLHIKGKTENLVSSDFLDRIFQVIIAKSVKTLIKRN